MMEEDDTLACGCCACCGCYCDEPTDRFGNEQEVVVRFDLRPEI